MKKKIQIRALEAKDIPVCVRLFKETVYTVNAKDYTVAQLAVWAPEGMHHTDKRWQSLLDNIAVVAECSGQIVGFADLTYQGYFDRLFVHKDFQRQGIAKLIIEELEKRAQQSGIEDITTEASITAKPFFESRGYQVDKQQEIERNGVLLTNFVMKKRLSE